MIHYKLYNFSEVRSLTCPDGCSCIDNDIVLVIDDQKIEEKWPRIKKIRNYTLKRLIYDALVNIMIKNFETENKITIRKAKWITTVSS